MKKHRRHESFFDKKPNHYKWGFLFFDRSDHRIIVPKRDAWMGWTFNFANPLSYIFIAAIIALAWWINHMLR